MAETHGPFAKVRCLGCGNLIEVKISACSAVADMDDLRDNMFRCAECAECAVAWREEQQADEDAFHEQLP